MVKIEDDHTGKAPLRNAILETIRNELQMDHYYISQTRTILVRINFETLENDILRDNQWKLIDYDPNEFNKLKKSNESNNSYENKRTQ